MASSLISCISGSCRNPHALRNGTQQAATIAGIDQAYHGTLWTIVPPGYLTGTWYTAWLENPLHMLGKTGVFAICRRVHRHRVVVEGRLSPLGAQGRLLFIDRVVAIGCKFHLHTR